MFFVLDIKTDINAYDIAHMGFDYSDIFQFVSLASHLTGTVSIIPQCQLNNKAFWEHRSPPHVIRGT